MSLLTPLYVIGALAVGLPVLFHLIQRRPRGQWTFSSLMFLSPSPPRLSRRSRLDNLLLLLLRAMALVLLALAFGRPFLRDSYWMDEEPPDRQVLVLLDTSASMQREGVWQQALAEVRRVLEDMRPTDEVALFAFDSSFQPVVPFSDGSEPPDRTRSTLFAAALDELVPTHAATELGRALAASADLLDSRQETSQESPRPKQIILVTDLQRGSELDVLRSFRWPQEVRLDVRRIATSRSSNARAVVIPGGQPTQDPSDGDAPWRATVFNAADSSGQQFHLSWADPTGRQLNDRSYHVQAPPGGSRTVRIGLPPVSAEHLILTGDEQPFDNIVFVARPVAQSRQILFFGDEGEDSRESLLYYVRRADFDTPHQNVTIQLASKQFPPLIAPSEVPLAIVSKPVPPEDVEHLRQYLAAGGRILWVLAQDERDEGTSVDMLRQLLPEGEMLVSEARVRDYAMLAEIDFTSPLFRPFADPRFNDFTKIRFWAHRELDLSEESAGRVLAWFDGGSPALVEYEVGAGRLWILAASWQPDQSQLARSSKFVPLLAGMLQSRAEKSFQASYSVGETVRLPEDMPYEQWMDPHGNLHDCRGAMSIGPLQVPGVYQLVAGQRTLPFAVNLSLAESRTEPLDVGELEAYGLNLGNAATVDELRAERRRQRDFELERSQKFWQWLLVGVLALLTAESWLAGRLSRRPLASAVPAPS